jgi:hypothetical protein
MAQVTGPLMSIDARGSFANTLTFTAWKGRRVVRFRAIPANPQTAGQMLVRSALAVTSAIASWMSRTAEVRAGATAEDETLVRSVAPADITWANYLTQVILGANRAALDAARAAWTALVAADKAAWEAEAATLAPPLAAAAQYGAGGAPIANVSEGELLYIAVRALAAMGQAVLAPAAPPNYA